MEFKTKPYKHQLEDYERFRRNEVYALLSEMGTGKTWIVINDIADLWSSDNCSDVLVIAPNGVHTNWTRLELPKHMPDWVKYKTVNWTANPDKKEKKALDEIFSGGLNQLTILAMNHEALQTKRGQEYAKRFCTMGRNLMIVVDEADSFKNPSAQRSKALMKLKPFSRWRRIMTGTLINNAPFDAFLPFSFLDEEILGTDSFFAFKNEYAEMLHREHPLLQHIKRKNRLRRTPQIIARDENNKPIYKNLDQLSKLIAPYSVHRKLEECVNMPGTISKTLIFSLTKQQIKVYKKAEDECRLVFENEETPFNKLVAAMKLAQITSGYYLHPEAEEPVRIDGNNPKLDLMMERVEKITPASHKIIIWARFRVEIADIVWRLKNAKIKTVEYHGGIKKKDREKAIDDFEEGDAQVFVGTPQAGGIGLTLIAAKYVIYFSNDFSSRKRRQSEKRAYRIGQKKKVIYINIAAKGTIDEHIINALMNKQTLSEMIVDKGLALFGEN